MDAHPDIALLAPVPEGLLEDGLRICRTKGKVAFGSRAWELFRNLDERRDGMPVDVLIYASHRDDTDRVVSWGARYVDHVEGVDGKHPEGRRYRSRLALEDGSGWWAVFWEVEDLHQVEPIPICELASYGEGKPYSKSFVPEGPILIERMHSARADDRLRGERYLNSHVDRIRPDSYGITTYLERLQRGEYQIPTFQRDVVWDRTRVKRLWDSIYSFYPLGSILVWRTETRLQKHREIGGHPLEERSGNGEYQYLLDGQQRTTALLTSMYGGSVKGKEGKNLQLYVDLTVEDADEVEDASWRERFLFWDEIDDRDGQLLRNAGRKKRFDDGLIVLVSDIAHQYPGLERRLVEGGREDYDDPARRQLRELKQVFDNYKLSFIELRGIEVAEVCQIFERINQAGQPLSMFDIVVAKTFRPEDDGVEGFYLRGMFEEFRRQLDSAGSRFAALDDMTLLQIVAVLVRENVPDSGVQNITDRYLNSLRTEHIEAIWDPATKAIRKTFDFFDNHLRLPGPALVPYRYFYMTLAAYFYENDKPDYDLLKNYFWYHSFHNDDLLSNTTHLRDHVNRLRSTKEGEEFGFGRLLIDRQKLRATSYSTRGRLSRAMLALYANQNPVDWAHTDRPVLAEVYYELTDNPNLHHIFPLDFCDKEVVDARWANSLLNIAYLTQITNLQISNRNPIDYMRDYLGDGYPEIERTHLLPEELPSWVREDEMPPDALSLFVEGRLDLVLDEIAESLKGISLDVIDTALQAQDGESAFFDGDEADAPT